MNADETPSALMCWTPMEQTLLMLSREREWAEAYADEHPGCLLGRLYLEFLQKEMVRVMAEL